MSHWFRFGSFLPLVLVLFAGCVSNRYEVELTPDGKSLKREITVWRSSGDKPKDLEEFPQEDLERIAKAYKAGVPGKRNEKHRFAADFAGAMPEDVGGRGSFTHWETSLGTLSIYVERFRGNDDLLSDVEDRMKACDQLATLLAGWLESELKDEPGYSELEKFLDGDFRRDVKNLSLLTWTFTNLGTVQGDRQLDERLGQELVIRAGQYLIERGYFTFDQAPLFHRAFAQEDPAWPLEYFQRFLATKLGVPKDQAVPNGLAFLEDPKAFEASVKKYLDHSPDYQKLVAAYDAAAADANAKAPKPEDVLIGTLLKAFPLWRIADDQLRVNLAAPVEPIWTNGQWSEEEKRVRWTRSLLQADSDMTEFPAMCYALWSEPNAKTQIERFGKVVLKGQALGKYCLWHQGLSEAEAKEWDTFLQSLKPGTDLASHLRTFRFSVPPDAQPDRNRLAKEPREWILEGLGEAVE